MMKRLIEKWFKLEPEVCISCDTLRSLLEQERVERARLTQALIEVTKPAPIIQASEGTEEPHALRNSSYVPWRVRRQALETEDRQKAKLMKQSTEELEKVVGISDASGTETEGIS